MKGSPRQLSCPISISGLTESCRTVITSKIESRAVKIQKSFEAQIQFFKKAPMRGATREG